MTPSRAIYEANLCDTTLAPRDWGDVATWYRGRIVSIPQPRAISLAGRMWPRQACLMSFCPAPKMNPRQSRVACHYGWCRYWIRPGAKVDMPVPNVVLKDQLSRYREIKITVIGRKSGRTISIPVWFVMDGDTLYLLPVQGSDTQWYKNVLANPSIRIDVRGTEADLQAVTVAGAAQVSSVVEKFRDKYGARDVKKYYSKFDAAVAAQVR
jgi:deazaflavin-dependent oxidoreductase (nitroreductase family)